MGSRDRGRRHSPEFKVEAVRLMRERLGAGVTLERVGQELDIDPDQLRRWGHAVSDAPPDASAAQIFPGHGRRRSYRPAPPDTVAPPLNAEEEVRQLRRENERLRLERDFLKKATAFFAKESR